MNFHSSHSGYDTAVRTWKQAYDPIAGRDVPVYEHKLTTALKKLPYLTSVTVAKRSDEESADLVLHAQLKGVKSNIESALKDWMTVINGYVVNGSQQAHSHIGMDPEGFIFELALLDSYENYFLGKVKVSLV